MLCIGGPLAGQRHATHKESGFLYPIKEDIAANDQSHPDWQPNEPVAAVVGRYREDRFHTPQGDVSFWVPQDQTPLETITMLLESYERTAVKERA